MRYQYSIYTPDPITLRSATLRFYDCPSNPSHFPRDLLFEEHILTGPGGALLSNPCPYLGT